jgi:DNA-binding transcriptional LysR family regulator
MDVRQLRTVLAIFEKGSIGRAAEVLAISQPALTKSLRRLEEELQVKLFDRTSRGMTPTLYGECLLSHAQAISSGLQHLRSNLESLKSGLSGIVEIGAPPIVAPRVFGKAIARLTEERPNVLVRVATELSPALVELVQNGRLDFAVTFTADEVVPRGCQRRFLFNDRLVIAARVGHPIAKARQISVRDVAKYPWILPLHDNLHRQRLELAFEAEGLPLPNAAIECNSVQLIKSMIQATDCIALVSKMSVDRRDSVHPIRTVELNSEYMTRQIGLVWREGIALSTAAKHLMKIVEKNCQSERTETMPRSGRS